MAATNPFFARASPPNSSSDGSGGESSTSHCRICSICLADVNSGFEDIILNCKCLVHFSCFSKYLKFLPEADLNKNEGVVCPNILKKTCLAGLQAEAEDEAGGRSKLVISVDDLVGLVDYRKGGLDAPPDSESAESIQHTCEKLRRWLDEFKASLSNPELSSDAYTLATTKPCPKCSYRASHFHGHRCHHVSCVKCSTAWCYGCGKATKGDCKCVSIYCDSTNIDENLVELPYPHDKRCGCAICPMCKPGKTCSSSDTGCSGKCVVCRSEVMPGPHSIDRNWIPFSATKMKQVINKRKNKEFRCAIDSFDIETFDLLLSDEQHDINYVHEDGNTSLFYLMLYYIDIDTDDIKHEQHSLILMDFLRKLLTNPNRSKKVEKGADGDNPLELAVKRCDLALFDLITSIDGDVSLEPFILHTAVQTAGSLTRPQPPIQPLDKSGDKLQAIFTIIEKLLGARRTSNYVLIINSPDDKKLTPLMYAAKAPNSSYELCALLLSRLPEILIGAKKYQDLSVSSGKETDIDAVMNRVSCSLIVAVAALMDNNGNVNKSISELTINTKNGTPVMSKPVQDDGFDTVNDDDNNVLMVAIEAGHARSALLLLQLLLDSEQFLSHFFASEKLSATSSSTASEGSTMTSRGMFNGFEENPRFSLEFDFNAKNNSGDNAFSLALSKNQMDVASELFRLAFPSTIVSSHKSSLQEQGTLTKNKVTTPECPRKSYLSQAPMPAGIQQGSVAHAKVDVDVDLEGENVRKKILDEISLPGRGKRFDINFKNRRGFSPLSLALSAGSPTSLNMARKLLDLEDIDVFQIDNNGKSIFMYAAASGDVEIVANVARRFSSTNCDYSGNTLSSDCNNIKMLREVGFCLKNHRLEVVNIKSRGPSAVCSRCNEFTMGRGRSTGYFCAICSFDQCSTCFDNSLKIGSEVEAALFMIFTSIQKRPKSSEAAAIGEIITQLTEKNRERILKVLESMPLPELVTVSKESVLSSVLFGTGTEFLLKRLIEYNSKLVEEDANVSISDFVKLRVLRDRFSQFNCKDILNKNALIYAIEQDNEKVIMYLLDQAEFVSVNETTINLAIEKKLDRLVSCLLRSFDHIKFNPSKETNTSMMKATFFKLCLEGLTLSVTYMLRNCSLALGDLNCTFRNNADELSPLMAAVKFGHTYIVSNILSHHKARTSVNLCIQKRTALGLAFEMLNGRPKTDKAICCACGKEGHYFLYCQKDFQEEDNVEATAFKPFFNRLMLTRYVNRHQSYEREDMILLLLQTEILSYTAAQNSGKQTALMLAIQHMNVALIETFLKLARDLGKDIGLELQDNDGNSALHLFLSLYRIEESNSTIGKDINFKYVSSNKFLKILENLLSFPRSSKAYVFYLENVKHITPVDLAIQVGSNDVFNLLLNYGLKPQSTLERAQTTLNNSVSINDRRSFLSQAILEGKTNLVDIIMRHHSFVLTTYVSHEAINYIFSCESLCSEERPGELIISRYSEIQQKTFLNMESIKRYLFENDNTTTIVAKILQPSVQLFQSNSSPAAALKSDQNPADRKIIYAQRPPKIVLFHGCEDFTVVRQIGDHHVDLIMSDSCVKNNPDVSPEDVRMHYLLTKGPTRLAGPQTEVSLEVKLAVATKVKRQNLDLFSNLYLSALAFCNSTSQNYTDRQPAIGNVSGDEPSNDDFQIFVRQFGGRHKTMVMSVNQWNTVDMLKQRILSSSSFNQHFRFDNLIANSLDLKLFNLGRLLDDNETLRHYSIKKESTLEINLVKTTDISSSTSTFVSNISSSNSFSLNSSNTFQIIKTIHSLISANPKVVLDVMEQNKMHKWLLRYMFSGSFHYAGVGNPDILKSNPDMFAASCDIASSMICSANNSKQANIAPNLSTSNCQILPANVLCNFLGHQDTTAVSKSASNLIAMLELHNEHLFTPGKIAISSTSSTSTSTAETKSSENELLSGNCKIMNSIYDVIINYFCENRMPDIWIARSKKYAELEDKQ